MEEQEPINQITEPLKPVNLPYGVPDWVGKYELPYKSYAPNSNMDPDNYHAKLMGMVNEEPEGKSDGFSTIFGSEVPKKYPSYISGIDNEELYAQNQSIGEKWKNGIVKMSGLATATFIQGTAGLLYGAYKWREDGKFNSFYNNDLSNALNDWTTSQEDKYANYKTQREINGNWWEPSNLFTANFWTDNVVKNLGFSIGAMAGGFAWGALLKAIGLTARLTGMGAKMASSADDVIANSIKASAAQRLPTAVSGLQKTWNGAKSTVGAGLMKADRAIVATFATAGESGIEALHNSKEFRESLIQDFKNTRGYSPNEEDIEEINRYAESVGNTVYGLNTVLLTVSNYIMLPKIFSSSFKGETKLANNIVREAGKYTSSLPSKGIAGALYKGSKIAGLTFSKEEAFEEGAQFAIQVGVDNYFHKKAKGYQNLSVLDDGILEGVRETLTSSEGWLNISIGGLSGAIMTGIGKVKTRGFTGTGGKEGKLRNEAITALNNSQLKDKLRSAYTNIKAAEIIQEEREAAIKRGDILESKDLEFDYAHNFVETRLKYNAKESIDFEIQQLKEEASTEEGFLTLQQEGIASETDTRKSFIARLDNLQQHANLASNLHEALTLRYGGKLNEKGKRVYSDKSIDALIYAATKIQNYDNRLLQLSTELLENGVDPQALLSAENREEYTTSILDNIDITKKDEVSEKLKDFLELERRKKIFAEQYESIKNEPSAYKDDVAETEELEAKVTSVPEDQREKITLKTKDGEEEIEIGTEYYLGKTVKYDKDGKEIYAFPRLTILAKNEDGTIKIKDSDGNVKDVDPSILVDYKLGKVSDTLKNANANFYLRNINNVVYWNTGKSKKGKIPGRLTYDSKNDKLYFTYKDKGKIKNLKIGIDQFTPKEGFVEGLLTFGRKLTTEDTQDIQKRKEEGNTTKDKIDRREVRLSILDQLFDELTKKQEQITTLIQQKKNQVNEIIEELASLEESIKTAEFDKRSKKALRFKSQAKKALEATMVLSRMKDQLEQEIENLKIQEEDLEINATYVADMAQNIDDLPTDSNEFIEELKEQRDLLDDAVLNTGIQINSLSSLIDTIESTIDKAVSFLRDIIDEFTKKYPKVPLSFGQEWVDFLKSNPNFLKRKPNYKEDLKELDNLIAEIEDVEITANEDKIKEYKNQLTELYKQLEEVGRELTAKELILSRFEKIAEQYKKKKEEENLLVKNKQIIEKLIGTHTKEDPNNVSEKEYESEAKKSDNAVINGTVAIDDGKPHQTRANTFGINFKNFPKELRASLRAIEITEKTEGLAGIPGLIKHLLGDTKIKSNTVVAVIFVKDEGDGKFSFIDENGEVITDNLIDKAIYQVRPTEKLEKNYSDVEGEYDMQTMFRSTTSEEVETELRERYAKQRAAVLASDTLQPMKEVTVSLGRLDFEKTLNSKNEEVNDLGAQNAVEDTNLVSEEDISERLMLEVPTLNNPTPENGVTFSKAIGRVLLRISGLGLIKLNPSRVGKRKAETLYQVIVKVAKNISEDPAKGAENSSALFNWLRTVVYWGIQRDPNTSERKEPVTNSVWFEQVDGITRLFIGKEGNNFIFTPSGLEANKSAIVSALQDIYHNVSNSELKKHKKYIEILGFNTDGSTQTKAWDNYQSYLLSKEGRKSGEIPLTTPILAIKGTNKINRKGIYFVLQDNIESEVAQKKAPEQKKEEELPVSEKPEVGKITTFTSSDGNVIYFTLNEEGYIVLKPGGDIKAVAEKLTNFYKEKNPEASDVEIRELVNDAISKKILDHYAKPFTPVKSIFGKKSTPTPTPTPQPVSDIEAKKADIEQIEADRKAELDKSKTLIKEFGQVAQPSGDVNSKLKEIGSFIKNTLGWNITYINASKENNRIELTVDGKQINLPEGANIRVQAGNQAYASFTLEDIINAKYNAKLKALDPTQQSAQSAQEAKTDVDTKAVEIPTLYTVKVDLKSLTIEELENVAKQLRQKAVNIRQAEKEGVKDLTGTGAFTENDYQAVKKYIAELKALDQSTVKPPAKIKGIVFTKGLPVEFEDDPLREKVASENAHVAEDWKALEKWLKANFPNIPVYRVKHAITSTNGKQAWGMLHKGAIYLTENAEIGTAYHEVFEAVWKMLTPKKEQQAVLDEFKNRKGTFTNRFTGEVTSYMDANDFDIKEELAEEFRDYILYRKIPAKPTVGKSFIVKLFADIYNFIKSFFTGEKAQLNTANLFEKIGTGYYRTYNQYESKLSFAKKGIIDINDITGDESSEFRLKIPYVYKHELMQHLTYSILSELIRNNASLFNIEKLNKKEVYSWLKDKILSLDLENPGILQRRFSELSTKLEGGKISQSQYDNDIDNLTDLYEKIMNGWNELTNEHTIYLKQYAVEFDENDNIIINDEDKDKGADGHPDARKVDSFRKANPAIKLLLSTIPEVYYNSVGKIKIRPNSIGGVSTLPLDKTFITLKNKLYNSIDVDHMLSKLKDIAKDDINYRSLYTRLTKKPYSDDANVDFDSLNETYDLELVSAFYKSMKAQNPDVKVVFILPSGEVEIGDAHLSSAVRALKYEIFTDIQQTLKRKNPYVEFDTKTKTYNSTKTVKELKLEPGNINSYSAFLKNIGVGITKQELAIITKKGQLKIFEDAVNGIKTGIDNLSGLKDINKYSFNLEGRLMAISALKASILNPEFESTYFNINGERTQTYIGTNIVSDLHNILSNITNKQELLGGPYEYLLTDSFSTYSVVMDLIFNPKTGNKKENADNILSANILSVGIVEGIVDDTRNKSKESSKVTPKERLIQELNLNSKGWFLNLVPGDASIEWMIRLFNEKNPFVSSDDLKLGYNQDTIFSLFKGYFISEVYTAREGRKIFEVGNRSASDLRFFKGILGKNLHDKIVKDVNSSAEELYESNKKDIENAIKDFIKEKADKRFIELEQYGIIRYGEEGIETDTLGFISPNASKENIVIELEALEANYIIANMELHKLIYSDPYFYKDELKRTKNFNSPAQDLINSPRINKTFDHVYNKNFEKGSLGWTDFIRPYLVSATIADVTSFLPDVKDYELWTETDGGGIITMQAYRKVRLKSANWTEKDEKQYQFDIKYEKLVKSGATKEEIAKFSEKNPAIKSAYTPIKPIVRGSKQDGNSYNDIVLDKFALVPFSFRILHQMNPESNALKHYQRMIDYDVDYVVFDSGRKVGANYKNSLYDKNGNYTSTPFLETSNIPFDIFKIQTEVPSKDKPEVTQGTQITKLVTMDFMDAGVPLDFNPDSKLEDRIINWMKLSHDQKIKASEIYTLLNHNETLLIERIHHGYDTLLKKLGIEQKGKQFRIENKEKLVETLTSEIYKREVNDNIISAFDGFKSGEVILEATPAYQQIRNILYSIANRQVTKPTISGGMKVQVSSVLLESVRAKADEKRYISDVLKFYKNKDGERVAEIMVGRWFKSDMTDSELLNYLNNTEEGQKILKGVAFRIPTQKQNSIDVFKIAQFLPAEFGDSVIVPSALVNKAGSDFDIDKLSIYFKNIYKNLKGEIKAVPFFGYGQKAKDELGEMFDNGDFLSEKDRKTAMKWITNRKIEDKDEAVENLFISIFGEQTYDDTYVQEVMDDLLESRDYEDLKNKIVNEKYRQSLENEYIESLENIISHPSNFDKLVKPNSADDLIKLSDEITEKLGFEVIDYSSTSNMLDRSFMEGIRHAFVGGKHAIGIAATSQTNNSQMQRVVTTIDYSKLKNQSNDDKKWLGDSIMRFKEFNKINNLPTFSISRSKDGSLISDIIGMFIDGYVDITKKGPWIMKLGANPNVTSTWLFLIKLGVPVNTVAYFMNQPIIKEHLSQLENEGYTWIFNDRIYKDTISNYSTSTKIDTTTLPSEDELGKMVGKNVSKMTEKEKAQQVFIFNEFFKYSKLGEHLFHVQQASNHDTANMNDPFLILKKEMQIDKAKGTMISSVDDLLDNSFVGTLRYIINDIRNAFAEILISDKKGGVREVLENVLLPYIDTPDKDFIKISQKAVLDLFDWAVQNNTGLNSKIQSVLLGSENRLTSAQEIMNFVKEVKKDDTHPLFNNYIINSIRQSQDSIADNKPHNLYLAGKNNKTYNQNNTIYGFSEIKDYLENDGKLGLYKKLVDLAILQSGLSNSKISFSQLLPYEDFKEVYNESLSMLTKIPNLEQFFELDTFERNNWSNPDIVASKKSKWLKLKEPFYDYITQTTRQWIKVPEIDFLPKALKQAIAKEQLPRLIQLSKFSKEGNEDFVVFSWEKDISKQKKQEMRKKGDYSYIQKGLFKKVYGSDGLPLISSYTSKKGITYESYIFKPINAWGDSYRANEFYTTAQESKIDNGFIKVKEIEDTVIENIMYPSDKKQPKKETERDISAKTINIYAGTNENAELSNFANRPFVSDLGKFNTVEGAFQAAKDVYSDVNNPETLKLPTATGSQAKAIGRNLKGVKIAEWDKASSRIMKELLKQSFEQNPNALAKLLATGNATLTHTQDKGKWGTEFPKLLMEVREELKNEDPLKTGHSVTKIISGGQTGVDVAGLDAALELGITTGGTAAAKFQQSITGDKKIFTKELAIKYGLKEGKITRRKGQYSEYDDVYYQRTIDNAQEADGTIWFGNETSPGGRLTLGTQAQVGKPKPLINPKNKQEILNWLNVNNIKVLNIAGNREHTNPGIYNKAKSMLIEALKDEDPLTKC